MWKQLYSGTGTMTRFLIRRDRIRFPIWLIALSFITIITATAFTGLYKSDEERQAIAETMKNPAMTAMVGPGYGLDHYTEGPMMAHQMLLFTAIVVAIMSILLVTRHTRADEEEGRLELIRSLPVGRLSSLSATMIVLIVMNSLLAIIIGVGLYSLRIGSMDLEGSLLYGVVLGTIGIFFSAVTAFFAQVSSNARGTIGLSFTVLGISYLIRAIGDVSNETISWFSPLGWGLKTEVYVNNYWWPIGLTILLSIILMILAYYLNTIRDVGAGIISSRPGRKHASRLLQSSLGLAFRIQRTSIITWAIGMLILGVSYGSVFGDLESFFSGNEIVSQMLTPVEGLTLTEQFVSMLMSVISMISTVPALMFLFKLKGEEKQNRTEHLLTRAVSRYKLLGSYLFLSMVLGFVMLCLAVIGLWSAAANVMQDPISFSLLCKAAIVYLPAIWMMTGLGVFVIGVIPRFSGFAWLYLGYSFFVVYLGELLQFPEWMGNLSPFGHVPQVPVEEINYVSITLLTCFSVFLMIIGFIGYRKRDIEG